MSALSGVEMALWDLKGKALNVPVYELFGGRVRDRIPCYANGWFAPAKTPDEFAAKAVLAVDKGLTALKWDPFGSDYRTISRRELNTALACVTAVHQVLGNRADLLIEAHGRFDLPAAIRIAQALEPFGILWMEEPIAPDSLEALADLRQRVRVPIAAGERIFSQWDYARFLALGCADYAQPMPSTSRTGIQFEPDVQNAMCRSLLLTCFDAISEDIWLGDEQLKHGEGRSVPPTNVFWRDGPMFVAIHPLNLYNHGR